MKKTLSLIMACVLAVSLLALPAYAANGDPNERSVESVEYQYFANAWAGLSPSGGGWYDVTGGAGSVVATMNIKVTVTLQKLGNGSGKFWEDIATWTGEGFFSASAGGPRYIITSGTYRTKMYAEIYNEDGTFGESETAYSDHLIIP